MYHKRPYDFERYLTGPADGVEEYWAAIANTNFVKKHPKLKPHSFSATVPLGMHGDAGSFSHHDSLLVLAWNSILGRGITRKKRFVFTFVRKRDYTEETLDALWRIFRGR